MRAVVDAAADHLCADWVVFALVDGELADARPATSCAGRTAPSGPTCARFPTRSASTCSPSSTASPTTTPGTTPRCTAARARPGAARRPGRRGFVAWTPPSRDVDDTDRSVLGILAGQTAAALQNCALLGPLGPACSPAHPPGRRPGQAPRRAAGHPGRAGRRAPARGARLRTAPHRARAPRQRHPVRALGGHAHRAGPHGGQRPTAAHPPRHRQGPHAARRRAARSAIYALHHGEGEADEDLPSMLRRLSGVHMPDELRVEVRIGGKPVPLPADCEQSLFRIAGEALFNTAVHADATRAVVRLAYSGGRVRLTISDDGCGRPEEVRRSLRAASVASPVGRAPRAGQHGGAGPRAGRHADLPAGAAGRAAGAGGHPDAVRSRGTNARERGRRGDEDGHEGDGTRERLKSGRGPGHRIAADAHPDRAGRRPRDHAAGPAAVLEREADLHVVGEAGTPTEAVAAVATARPHVVLLDLKLTAGPQTDGLDVCRRLCAAHPGIGVLVLTTFAEDRLVVESVQAGARGYVVKDVDTTELVRACGPCRAARARSTPAARRRWCARSRAGCPTGSGSPTASSTCCGCSRGACRTGPSARSCSSPRRR